MLFRYNNNNNEIILYMYVCVSVFFIYKTKGVKLAALDTASPILPWKYFVDPEK